MPGLIDTWENVATAFPLPSTATPEAPPAVPATPGKAAAALHVPPDLTEYLTPPLMSHTTTAVPSFPSPTLGCLWRYTPEAPMVAGAPQAPVTSLLMATTAAERIPGAPSTATASPLEFTASSFHPKHVLALEIVFAEPKPLVALPVATCSAQDMGLGLVICSQTTVA